MAFLRLWLDPEARPNGKVKGEWYAEPVYYADIPAIRAGTYVPKACATHMARTSWEPVPESAMRLKPVTVFFGDVLVVDERVARYAGFNINSKRMKMVNLLTKLEVPDWPPFGGWGRDTRVYVLQEDCLGHCYEGMATDFENSSIKED